MPSAVEHYKAPPCATTLGICKNLISSPRTILFSTFPKYRGWKSYSGIRIRVASNFSYSHTNGQQWRRADRMRLLVNSIRELFFPFLPLSSGKKAILPWTCLLYFPLFLPCTILSYKIDGFWIHAWCIEGEWSIQEKSKRKNKKKMVWFILALWRGDFEIFQALYFLLSVHAQHKEWEKEKKWHVTHSSLMAKLVRGMILELLLRHIATDSFFEHFLLSQFSYLQL